MNGINYNAGSAALNTMPDVRVTEVGAEIDRIATTTEYLDKCLSDLESKLNPVLAQHKVAGVEGQTQPEPLRVPLAETLHIRGNHLENLRERVSSMITRLEI